MLNLQIAIFNILINKPAQFATESLGGEKMAVTGPVINHSLPLITQSLLSTGCYNWSLTWYIIISTPLPTPTPPSLSCAALSIYHLSAVFPPPAVRCDNSPAITASDQLIVMWSVLPPSVTRVLQVVTEKHTVTRGSVTSITSSDWVLCSECDNGGKLCNNTFVERNERFSDNLRKCQCIYFIWRNVGKNIFQIVWVEQVKHFLFISL